MVKVTITTDASWKKMIRSLDRTIRNKNNYRQELVDILSEGLLKICKDITPTDTGELRDAWKIFEKGLNRIVIGNELPDALARIVRGISAQTIVAKNGKSMHFFLDGEEFFRQRVDIKGKLPDDFLEVLLYRAIDKAILDLELSLMPKHFPFFKDNMTPRPKGVNRKFTSSNLAKTVGLTEGKINKRRGRGGGIQKAKTGRKSFRRVLSRRRRTGTYITSKKVKLG